GIRDKLVTGVQTCALPILARIEGRWRGTGITSTGFADANHLYANDLDIFGEGSLFDLICTARTRVGQETLAKWLCIPASRMEIQIGRASCRERVEICVGDV